MVWEHQCWDHQWIHNFTKEVMWFQVSDLKETMYFRLDKSLNGQKIGLLIMDLSLFKSFATDIMDTQCLILEFLIEKEKRFKITEKAKIPSWLFTILQLSTSWQHSNNSRYTFIDEGNRRWDILIREAINKKGRSRPISITFLADFTYLCGQFKMYQFSKKDFIRGKLYE